MSTKQFQCIKEQCNYADLRPLVIEQENIAVVKFYCPSCYGTYAKYTVWHTLAQVGYALNGAQNALDLLKEIKGMGGKSKLLLGLAVLATSFWLSWKQNQAKTNGQVSSELASLDAGEIYKLLIHQGFKPLQHHE